MKLIEIQRALGCSLNMAWKIQELIGGRIVIQHQRSGRSEIELMTNLIHLAWMELTNKTDNPK